MVSVNILDYLFLAMVKINNSIKGTYDNNICKMYQFDVEC